MFRLGLIGLACLLCGFQLRAGSVSRTYFDLSVLNVPGKEANVLMVLELKPNVEKALLRLEPQTDALVAHLGFQIEARSPGSMRTLHTWNFRHLFRQGSGEMSGLQGRFPFSLEPGLYEFHCEMEDLFTHRRFFEIIRFDCRPPSEELRFSDLFLQTISSFGPVSLVQDLFGERVESTPDSICYRVEVTFPRESNLVIRTNLYRRQEDEGHDALGGGLDAELFRSFLQITEAWKAKNGKSAFKGSVPLADASDGQYRLELGFYEDDTLLATITRDFDLEWPRMREVFENLDRSIDWMRWIAPDSERERLCGLPEGDEKQRGFMDWWQKRCKNDEDARAVIKRYYARIFEAQHCSGLKASGWDTDRGRIYVHFGAPDRMLEPEFGTQTWSLWIYRKWNLFFLFKESGENMILVRNSWSLPG